MFNRIPEHIEINSAAWITALAACTTLNDVTEGKRIHDMLLSRRVPLTTQVYTAILQMYSSFGNIDTARSIFEEMKQRSKVDPAAYVAMISALNKV
jgi:pentatricopeptide repeat protein